MRLEYELNNGGYYLTLRVFDNKISLFDTATLKVIQEKTFSPQVMEKMLRKLKADYFERTSIQKLCDYCINPVPVGLRNNPMSPQNTYTAEQLRADIDAHNKEFHKDRV
jgi:hypothetical protein